MKHLAFLFVLLPLAAETDRPLRLEDVLESVERNYPPLLSALEEQAIADADLLSAQGRFDILFRGRVDSDSLGFYSNRRFDSSIEQPLNFQGLSFFSGYRVGDGSFAPYDGKLETRSYGEFRSGLRLPLLRDRATDSRRAEVAKARAGQQIAGLSIEQQKLLIQQTATRRYWDWVAAGRRFVVSRAVLEIAQARQSILEDAVKGGQMAAIEATDNRRAILQRQSQLVEAQRAFEQASIELSLYYRDAGGTPLLAGAGRVPNAFPGARELSLNQVQEDLKTALRRRPDLLRLAAQRDQLRVDAELARNQQAPLVDLVAGFTAEGGSGPVKRGPQEFKASLVFELPWQRRTATGRFQAAEARTRQLDQRERFTADQITAEVRDAHSAVRAAQQRVQLLQQEIEVTRSLEDAERARFELGEGTLFMLNLREQATAEAAIREILAQADYQRALAIYDYAIARGPDPQS